MTPFTGTMTGYLIFIITPERVFSPEHAVLRVVPAEGGAC
jgi:hypothetical protein